MNRTLELVAEKMEDKQSALEYLNEFFVFETPVHNLDALADALSEVSDDVQIVLHPRQLRLICKSAYGFRALVVLGDACNENPHLKIHFAE